MNFLRHGLGTAQRQGIYEMHGATKWVTTEGGFDHVSIERFYEQLASHDYAFSPPGAGPDCHRNWEALALGCIPVVIDSPAMRVLDGMPHIKVKHWGIEEITEERLLDELDTQRRLFASPAMERMDMRYWRKRILEDAP
jgi:hypothetical protein